MYASRGCPVVEKACLWKMSSSHCAVVLPPFSRCAAGMYSAIVDVRKPGLCEAGLCGPKRAWNCSAARLTAYLSVVG